MNSFLTIFTTYIKPLFIFVGATTNHTQIIEIYLAAQLMRNFRDLFSRKIRGREAIKSCLLQIVYDGLGLGSGHTILKLRFGWIEDSEFYWQSNQY